MNCQLILFYHMNHNVLMITVTFCCTSNCVFKTLTSSEHTRLYKHNTGLLIYTSPAMYMFTTVWSVQIQKQMCLLMLLYLYLQKQCANKYIITELQKNSFGYMYSFCLTQHCRLPQVWIIYINMRLLILTSSHQIY